ncbi:MAG: hypothetical protein DRO99_02650 [Candidatus Aenigmatarchaeota archaeon]|nr:MAG: hypothetical protein DRO99_02650 [Candidatus Aenigmarchaeota archaeon]
MPKRRKGGRTTKVLKADFHVHTAMSGDSDISCHDIIREARLNYLDVVGVVDHNTTRGAIETRELASREMPGLLILVGQEVKTESGEIMVFGIEKDLPPDRPLLDTCKAAKKLGGFIVAPHPFDFTRHGIGGRISEIRGYLDAVEVLNSKSIWKRFNEKAKEFAFENRLPMVGGSDAHFPQYIGMCYTLVGSRPYEDEIYSAIRDGRTLCSGKVSGILNKNMVSRLKYLIRK